MSAVPPEIARRTFRATEPIHAMIYFTPHGADAYAQIGITHQRMTYFASRSAAMGAVPAEIVIATFFNFNPAIIHEVIPAAWDIAAPAQVLAAPLVAVVAAVVVGCGGGSSDSGGSPARRFATCAAVESERWPGLPGTKRAPSRRKASPREPSWRITIPTLTARRATVITEWIRW